MAKKASEGHPRKGDLPIHELVAQANEQIAKGWVVYFKFTCAHCGTRCTLEDANTMWPEVECFNCGEFTEIDCGGFMLTNQQMKGA